MINLCLVVIATQFSETKKRETAKMKAEREKFSSTSSLSTVESRYVFPRIVSLNDNDNLIFSATRSKYNVKIFYFYVKYVYYNYITNNISNIFKSVKVNLKYSIFLTK